MFCSGFTSETADSICMFGDNGTGAELLLVCNFLFLFPSLHVVGAFKQQQRDRGGLGMSRGRDETTAYLQRRCRQRRPGERWDAGTHATEVLSKGQSPSTILSS